MKILSLFDGMSCGMIAFKGLDIPVERYVAYEIDKYAVKTSTHNFPEIEQKGDVFSADFAQYEGFDWLIGGSPCTYWSIAQTKNRETTASGLGWDLFSQYVRALREAKPKFFLYENNKSMSKDIRDMIRKTFGFDEICINSALVSAQNRQRYYWVGVRQDDGTYCRADVEQPEDRGILLKDVLDQALALKDKSGTIDANYYKGDNYSDPDRQSGKRMTAAEPVLGQEFDPRYSHGWYHAVPVNPTTDGKSGYLTASYYKTAENPFSGYGSEASRPRVAEPVRVGCMPSPDGSVKNSQGMRVYSIEGKSSVQTAQGGGLGAKTGLYAVPVNETVNGKSGTLRATCYKDGIRNLVANEIDRKTGFAEPCAVAERGRYDTEGLYQHLEVREGGKTSALTTVEKDNHIAEPCFGRVVGRRINDSGHRADDDQTIECVQRFEVNDDPKKTNCLTTVEKDNRIAEPILQYAIPVEFDGFGNPTKAISGADGKTYTVYSVSNGQITIKGRTYPIKLVDGYWIIRKLTVSECKRLQTVPDWYDFSCISNTQAYKMLGNGWTVEVIKGLINDVIREWTMELLL